MLWKVHHEPSVVADTSQRRMALCGFTTSSASSEETASSLAAPRFGTMQERLGRCEQLYSSSHASQKSYVELGADACICKTHSTSLHMWHQHQCIAGGLTAQCADRMDMREHRNGPFSKGTCGPHRMRKPYRNWLRLKPLPAPHQSSCIEHPAEASHCAVQSLLFVALLGLVFEQQLIGCTCACTLGR